MLDLLSTSLSRQSRWWLIKGFPPRLAQPYLPRFTDVYLVLYDLPFIRHRGVSCVGMLVLSRVALACFASPRSLLLLLLSRLVPSCRLCAHRPGGVVGAALSSQHKQPVMTAGGWLRTSGAPGGRARGAEGSDRRRRSSDPRSPDRRRSVPDETQYARVPEEKGRASMRSHAGGRSVRKAQDIRIDTLIFFFCCSGGFWICVKL